MNITKSGRRASAAVAIVVASSLAAGGVAVAYTPGGNNTIKGCYAKKGGALRVVNSSAHCPKGTKTLQWNVKGRTGATGKTGARGKTGATGPRGPQGPGALALRYRRDAADSTPTTLATYRGYSLVAECIYYPAQTQSATALWIRPPAWATVDLVGHAVHHDDADNAIISQGPIRKYDESPSNSSDLLLVGTAYGNTARPHTTATYDPVSVTGWTMKGMDATFDITATLSSYSGAAADTSGEGRCHIDGTLTPTG